MKTKDDNWQHDLTELYLIGALTEEQVREEIEAMRADVETVPMGLQKSRPIVEGQEAA